MVQRRRRSLRRSTSTKSTRTVSRPASAEVSSPVLSLSITASWVSHSISTTSTFLSQPSDTEGGVTDVTTATKVSIKPLEDRVVVQANEAETTTASGLVIPDTAKEKPQEGEVIAVGPGARDERGEIQRLDVKPGDRVLFGKWSGSEVRIDNEEYLIMKEADLLGVIESTR